MTPPRRCRSPNDSGMVTVEAAIAIFALVFVLTLCAAAITTVANHLRCTDAAREAARLVARGEPDRATALAHTIAPANATVKININDDDIEVEISAPSPLPGLHLTARAYSVLEPTTP